MAGRSNGFNKNIAKKIIDTLSDGNTLTASVKNAGISYDRFLRWQKENTNFANDLEKAEAQAEVGHVSNVKKASDNGSWQASAWWLERRRHGDWRKREDVNLGNQNNEPLRIEVVRKRANDQAGTAGTVSPATGD
jgi:hypothetical protein